MGAIDATVGGEFILTRLSGSKALTVVSFCRRREGSLPS